MRRGGGPTCETIIRSAVIVDSVTVDFRPGIVFSLKDRRFDHGTPQYLRYRIQAAVRAAIRPREPSLTPQSIRDLERLLHRDAVGVEWGSGNTTRFFAKRTQHLTSVETDPAYHERVVDSLRAEGVNNVEHVLIEHDFEGEDDEEEMHRNAVVRVLDRFAAASLDYALIDSAPRGCLCHGIAPKLKAGGLLILDNANWYLPPPSSVRPPAPGSVAAVPGMPGSTIARHECGPAFAKLTAGWRALWSSNGVQMTLILVKP